MACARQLREIARDPELVKARAGFAGRRAITSLADGAWLGRPKLDALRVEQGKLGFEWTCISPRDYAVCNDQHTRVMLRVHVSLSVSRGGRKLPTLQRSLCDAVRQ